MNVLVTGGAGFIGSTLCRKLLKSGCSVTILDNLDSGERGEKNVEELATSGARLHRGDIRDREALARAVRGADAVVHLAAMASVAASIADPGRCWEINAEGTNLVLEQAVLSGVRRVVLASTAAVYGMDPQLPSGEMDPLAPASPYAEAKIAAEQACRKVTETGGLHAVALRFFNVYGPGQDPASSYSGVISRWVDALQGGRPVEVYGDGSQTRDFVHVEDIASAILLALRAQEPPVEAVNIGSGVATSLCELLHHLGRACEVEPQARYHPFRTGDVRHSRADISRARKYLGFSPQVELGAGLRTLV